MNKIINKIKNIYGINKIYFNIPGWRTKRKIVVFESDDWGSIRMPSKEVFDKVLAMGYPVDKCYYNKNDCIESNDDMEFLLETISMYKDKTGNHPVITMNNIVGNPDFDKIKKNNYTEYFYEPFVKTLERYPKHNRVINLYKEGIKAGCFNIQYHGREHVNIFNWMRDLQNPKSNARKIFDLGLFSTHFTDKSNCRKEYLDGHGTTCEEEEIEVCKILDDGIEIFEKIWGYKAKTFTPNCYIWNTTLENRLYKHGIMHIQSGRVQKTPNYKTDKYTIKRLYTGKINKNGQIYTSRNVHFEPVENPDKDWVNSALKEIDISFKMKKPAILSSHRVNFIGTINEKNRDRNLRMLKRLIENVLKIWPDVEFMSSEKLGQFIRKSYN